MKRALVIDVICFLLILLFIYAAVYKLMDVKIFRMQIAQSALLKSFAGWLVWIIPLSEIITAILLIIPRFRVIGLYSSLSLMVMFTGYIVYTLNFSEHIPCACGGVLAKLNWTEHLYFNIVFVLITLVGIVLYPKKETINNVYA